MKKSIIKYRHGNEEGYMHYIILDKKFVVLSQFESTKVSFINEHGNLDITFDLKSDTFDPVKAEIVTEKEYVTEVLEAMLQTENSYYKEYNDSICAIIIHK